VTSDIEFNSAMSGTVAGGSLRGREGTEALFADIRDTWEEHRMVIEVIRDLGDRVLGLGRLEGHGKASGVSVDVPLAVISDFRDGKVWRTRTHLDHDAALRAAGGVEEPRPPASRQIVYVVRASDLGRRTALGVGA
jgi:ketosteroid isomerase-like protein